MNTLQCKAFLTAVDYGSLTAAGNVMGYTQSGITRMIRSLEEEVGFELFIRSRKGVEPTENGRTMIPAFREFVRAQEAITQTGDSIRGVTSGSLTIGTYYSVAAGWMPRILSRFQQKYPNVRVTMREGGNREMTHWLGERSIDCSIWAKPVTDPGYDWLPVREDDLLVWLPEHHPLAGADAYPIRRLAREEFIATMPGEDTDIDRLLSKEKLQPDVRFTTADYYTTYCMVEAGLGISLNNRLLTENWSGRVVTLPFDPPQSIELGISIPSLSSASPATGKFIDCVMETCREEGL